MFFCWPSQVSGVSTKIREGAIAFRGKFLSNRRGSTDAGSLREIMPLFLIQDALSEKPGILALLRRLSPYHIEVVLYLCYRANLLIGMRMLVGAGGIEPPTYTVSRYFPAPRIARNRPQVTKLNKSG
jgi:hypothetical protein